MVLKWILIVLSLYRSQENYEIIKKIGRGKYSEVYEGINTANGERIVIKILKPGKFVIYQCRFIISIYSEEN